MDMESDDDEIQSDDDEIEYYEDDEDMEEDLDDDCYEGSYFRPGCVRRGCFSVLVVWVSFSQVWIIRVQNARERSVLQAHFMRPFISHTLKRRGGGGQTGTLSSHCHGG